MKITVIIPTYNECENIRELAELILSQDDRINIIIIDDNSPDGTGIIADQLAAESVRISVIHRTQKLGLGSAYREGFKVALNSGSDILIEMDADFSHDPTILPKFIEKMSEYDLVLGSRYINGVSVVNWPIRRLILSYCASVYTRLITGMDISDCTSGFKCFKRNTLEAIDLDAIKSDGYSFQIEMNFRCFEKGFQIYELPIIFVDRHSGSSKMSKQIVREAVIMVWKLKIGSICRLLLGLGRKYV